MDPELARYLDTSGLPEPIGPADVEAARAARRRPADEPLPDVEGCDVEDLTAGGGQRILFCRPRVVTGPPALLVFLHGGALMFHDRFGGGFPEACRWVRGLPVAVASVEYRMPPEHPHPAPVDDCTGAVVWLRDNAGRLGVDPSRIVLAGISAGAGLAAATALRLRGRGDVGLTGLVLDAPMLDDRPAVRSGSSWPTGPGVLPRETVSTAWNALLGGRAGAPDVSPYAAPARADRLGGLPRTFVSVGSLDAFVDETVEFTARSWADGSRAELHVWPGGFHGFEQAVPDAALSVRAYETRRSWLREVI